MQIELPAFRRMCWVGAALLATGAEAVAAGPADFMMRARVDGELIEGQPLAWDSGQMFLLGRDGQLHDFDPASAKDAKKTATRFVGYSSSEMQGRLLEEFDQRYGVSTTAHFVVVHPRGQWQAWAERLEQLYRSFTRYLSVRGFKPSSPKTPLPAIVFRNEAQYYKYAAANGTPLLPGTLGHYDLTTNRIYLFDASGGSGDAEWSVNADTIIHEAVHQTAYNVGVHRRFAEQPRWVVEGLAMMFEAPGVWNAGPQHQRSDRHNRYRLDSFRRTAEQRTPGWLAALVADDGSFHRATGNAYAEAWTLSFYLCETRPQQYCRYLARTAQRKSFSAYSAKQRVADFAADFGRDFTLLEAQLQHFVDELK